MNGRPVERQAKAALKDGDQIAIGDFLIQIDQVAGGPPQGRSSRSGETPASTAAGAGQAPLPPGSLVKKPTEVVALARARADQICQIAAAMQNLETLADLMGYALDIVLRTTRGKQAYIGLRTKSSGSLQMEEARTRDGRPCDPPAILTDLQPRVLNRGQSILVTQPPDANARSAMAVAMTEPKGVYGILYVDNGTDDEAFHTADLDFLTMVSGHLMARRAALATSQHHKRRAMAETEQAAAQKVQQMFKPRHVLQWDKLTLTAFHEAGVEAGGDTYDMARLPKGRAALAVSSGKGTHTNALLAIPMFKSSFRVSTLHMDAPHLLLQALNTIVMGQSAEPVNLSCASLIIDPNTGHMRYAVSGDASIFVVGLKGELHTLEEAQCPRIGTDKRATFRSASALVPPECTLVLHTSGVTGAEDAEGTAFGIPRLRDCLCDNFDQNPERMVRDLAQDLRDFMGSDKPPQDVTVLVARRSH